MGQESDLPRVFYKSHQFSEPKVWYQAVDVPGLGNRCYAFTTVQHPTGTPPAGAIIVEPAKPNPCPYDNFQVNP